MLGVAEDLIPASASLRQRGSPDKVGESILMAVAFGPRRLDCKDCGLPG